MIIYFSGIGNSRLVAQELHHRFHPDDKSGESLYRLEGDRLLEPARQYIEIPHGETVIWVFPIYSWGVPPVVLKFIDKIRFKGAEHARHFMVCTCGDDTGRADDQWRKHLGRRGWTPMGAFSVIMPNTYVCMKGFEVDPDDIEAGKLAAMPARVDEICKKIDRNFGGDDLTRGSWAWLKTNVVYPGFRAFAMSPMPFKADAARCISCGLCARECPMRNITMQDGHPQWGPVCAMCLRCFHHCPVRAIDYGTKTSGKKQYKAPLT
ncbi:MAG: EFR1 family ferrodoxin [Muribaculaceae bacterium]|nr:EFR1 family ferrodoxin [Muribaculaceae bacterium]